MPSYLEQKDGVFPSVCSLDCPDTCGLLVHKREGRIIKIEGNPSHPVTQGAICNKVRNMPSRLYDPARLQYPMKRVGSKGSGQFERISWQEAIETISEKWKSLIKEHGPESIMPYSFAGNMGRINMSGMGNRFFHRMGATRMERTICNAAGNTGYKYTMGASYGTDPEDTVHAKLLIFWGCNAVSTNMHQVMLAEKARKNGAQIVVIDVHENRTAKWADWFIPIVPGTDAALALAIMHVLFAENMVDRTFLQEHTVGYRELEEHVKQYDPVSVSKLTQVPTEQIYQLARLYGLTTPSFIRIGNGPQHHDNGGMFARTVACLPALTGQWQFLGGGALKENGDYSALSVNSLQRPELLEKPTRVINMNQIGEALMELDPPLRSLYVYNSNPLVVAPDLNKVKQGFSRDDLFTVVHELFLTETAKYADIVLPAASSYENMDIYTSYWHSYIHLQEPVIEKVGESKSNVEVFRLLAEAMGFHDQAFAETEEEMIRGSLDPAVNPFLEGVTWEQLKENSFLAVKRSAGPMFPVKLPTPSGKIELYSERLEKEGHSPLPVYTPIKEEETYPLLFVSGPNHHFLNSTFSNNEKHRTMEKGLFLDIHPVDAESRGLQQGERVRIFNGRGECELPIRITEGLLPGTVVSQGLWSNDLKSLVNVLTPSRLSDMGRGATFFSTRVEVEKNNQE